MIDVRTGACKAMPQSQISNAVYSHCDRQKITTKLRSNEFETTLPY